MSLKDDGGINEKTNELATLIPQCILDVGGEFFYFYLCTLVVGAIVPFGAFGVNHRVGGFLAFPLPLRSIPIYSHLFEWNPYFDYVSCSPLQSQNLDVD